MSIPTSYSAIFHALTAVCTQAIQQRIFSGCVLAVRWPDHSQSILPLGHDDYLTSNGAGENLPEVKTLTSQAIFDVASVTKSIPVSTLVLRRILLRELDPQKPLITLLPEFSTNYRSEVKLWHLLTHSLDYRFPLSSLRDLKPEAIWERLLTHLFTQPPGSSFSYGNAASILLGRVLERMTGEDLETLAQRELFAPLEMVDTTWHPLEHNGRDRIVPTEICPWRGRTIRGVVHDESAYTLSTLGPVGSAGVFSTGPDLLHFLDMLLADGVFEGKRILPAGILHLITQNALPHLEGQGTALGWELANRKFMGTICSEKTFGKTGFTGSCVIGDPERQAGFVLLSNFTWPRREATVERIYAVRRELADTLFAGLPT